MAPCAWTTRNEGGDGDGCPRAAPTGTTASEVHARLLVDVRMDVRVGYHGGLGDAMMPPRAQHVAHRCAHGAAEQSGGQRSSLMCCCLVIECVFVRVLSLLARAARTTSEVARNSFVVTTSALDLLY
jgi:hypothetical protein